VKDFVSGTKPGLARFEGAYNPVSFLRFSPTGFFLRRGFDAPDEAPYIKPVWFDGKPEPVWFIVGRKFDERLPNLCGSKGCCLNFYYYSHYQTSLGLRGSVGIGIPSLVGIYMFT
jgi:hypothetical protein